MLKESKEVSKLDKLHRERTRWVVSTWVLGALFVAAVVVIFSLGFYIIRPQLGEKFAELPSAQNEAGTPEAPPEEAPQAPTVAGVSVDDDPMKGSPDAKVTVIEFSDFLCPFCAVSTGFRDDLQERMKSRDENWEAAVPKIIENYVETGKVRFVFRDCPFHGESAIEASEAAQCAQDQGKYWEMHDLLFAKQEDFPTSSEDVPDFLSGLAQELGLDVEAFDQCLSEDKYLEEVNKDLEDAKAAGITGTPSYFINGRKLVGAQGFAAFAEIIEEELAKE